MFQLGSIAFFQPWLLLGLFALPVIWFLVRQTPPPPKVLQFPPVRFLFGLTSQGKLAARTPWWLLLFRMLIAAVLVVAVAQPLLNPQAALEGESAILVVIENSYAAGQNWEKMVGSAQSLLDRAARAQRPSYLLSTAPTLAHTQTKLVGPLLASALKPELDKIQPQPWPNDFGPLREALNQAELPKNLSIYWYGDGLSDSLEDDFLNTLTQWGELERVEIGASLIRFSDVDLLGGRLRLTLQRSLRGTEVGYVVRAIAGDGLEVHRTAGTFQPEQFESELTLDLPFEISNRIERVEIVGQSHAGAVLILDNQWRRRPVGLIQTDLSQAVRPLLSDQHYLEKALAPMVELKTGTIPYLLDQPLSVLIMPDTGVVNEADSQRLKKWIDSGGLLLRFAGPKLAVANDGFLPMPLRRGGRSLGTTLSWTEPVGLRDFEENGPLAGLVLPTDLKVRQQVLAEPDLPDNVMVWARLADGTPFITARKQEQGWVVLCHVTADLSWSNLPITGTFIDILKRTIDLSSGIASDAKIVASLPPLYVLDGFGRAQDPDPGLKPLIPNKKIVASPKNPPGLYGDQKFRKSVNLGPHLGQIRAYSNAITSSSLSAPNQERDLTGWFLILLILLLIADIMVSMLLTRGFRKIQQGTLLLLMGFCAPLVVSLGWPSNVWAQEADALEEFATEAALEYRLAYVVTGDPEVDRMSNAGLQGLTLELMRRTAVEPLPPLAIDPYLDEIRFLPLIYWPVTTDMKIPGSEGVEKLNNYLKTGGTILFDTRDRAAQELSEATGSMTEEGRILASVLSRLDLADMIALPHDHVMTRSFYLIDGAPGRYPDGTLWVENREAPELDGVSGLVVGSNDWAAAWAIDHAERPISPIGAGGEQQREYAYRFGINLVMYVLTGSYKTDQVHVPHILERLGQ